MTGGSVGGLATGGSVGGIVTGGAVGGATGATGATGAAVGGSVASTGGAVGAKQEPSSMGSIVLPDGPGLAEVYGITILNRQGIDAAP